MKILVVTLSNLGDVVLTLPVFQSLRQAHPDAEIHAVVSPGAKVVLEGDGRIRRLIEYHRRMGFLARWKMLRAVRAEHYDIIVDLRRSFLGFFGGAKTRNSYWPRPRKTLQRVAYHLHALKNIAPAFEGESFLRARVGAEFPELGRVEGKKIVVVAVGSKSDVKKWPASSFAAVLDRLALEQGCKIVLVGDKNDGPDAVNVKNKMISKEALDLTGRTTFLEMVSVISRADLVLTNDSSPLHVADSLKVPVVALFGPTDARKYGPRSAGSIAVSRELFCSPCEKAQCRYSHRECLELLDPDEVYQKTLLVLSGRTQAQRPRILVIRLDRMGDVMLSLPAIQALRERYPEAHLSVMLRPATRELLQGHPTVDEVIEYDYKKGRHSFPIGYFRFLKELRRRNFDVAIILHPGLRSFLLPFLAGIPRRVGYATGARFLLTDAVEDKRAEGLKHESQYALDVVRAFVPGASARVSQLFVSQARLAAAKDNGILIHPGSSCESKRWPLERFEALCRKISSELSYPLVLIGGKEEAAMGERLKKALGDKVTDLTGKLDLKELSALLKRSKLLVSNDSGPVHVAAAVGTPVISIFGRNQKALGPQRWKPLGQGHAVIQKEVGCVVCLAHECTIGFECLKAISVDEVYEKVREMV